MLTTGAVKVDIDAAGAGHAARCSCTSRPEDGNKGYTPVWNTSCDPATNPAPDYGLSACALTDGTIPPWSPDMSGRVVPTSGRRSTSRRREQTITIPLDEAARAEGRERRSALVAFQTPQDEVQAFDVPITSAQPADVGGTVPATLSLTLGAPAAFGAFTPGIAKDYFATTTATVISTAGDAALSVADPERRAPASWSTARSPAADAAGRARRRHATRVGSSADASRPASGADLQRRGHDRLQAVDRRQRAAAHGDVQQDADVHAVDDQPVEGCTAGAGHRGRRLVERPAHPRSWPFDENLIRSRMREGFSARGAGLDG